MNSDYEDVKLLYLLSGSFNVLPRSCIKLRSYLNIHVSNLAHQHNLQILKSFRNRNKTCPYCYSSWSGDTTSFKLLPSKRFKRRKRKNTTIDNHQKELPNESRNTLVLQCKVCTKKSSFSLAKRKLIEENVKQENSDSVKKKKKKKDRTYGLAVNLLKSYVNTQEFIVINQKKRMKEREKITNDAATNPFHSQRIESKGRQKNVPISKSLLNATNKNLVPNPFAAKVQQKFSEKKLSKKLERLKQAVKEEKSSAKKTLKDFLTLI